MRKRMKDARLSDASAAVPGMLPGLATAIRDLRELRGTPEQVDGLRSRLQPQFATAPPGKASAWPRLGLVLCTALIAAASLWLLRQPASVAPQSGRSALPQSAVATDAAIVVAEADAEAALRAEQSETRLTHPDNMPPAPRVTLPPTSRRAAKSKPPKHDELSLLQRAQAAFEASPARALALAEQHRREFRQGTFAVEREILAIEALVKLNDAPALRARAQRFVATYPSSPHVRRIERLLHVKR